MRYQFIHNHERVHRITAMCRVLKVSRSGYYGWKARPECARAPGEPSSPPSMSRQGDCYDNACAESFFSGLKNELVWDRDFRTRSAARAAIFEWIEVFYNRQRLHQSLDYVSPVRYEARARVA